MFYTGIVAHSTRMEQARALSRQVNATFISVDDGMLGCDGNHQAVHNHLVNLPSTWSVILEDDAVPIPDFTTQLETALPMSPSPIISFYLGKLRPVHWQRRIHKAIKLAQNGASWIAGTHLLHAVGYAIRRDLLPSLIDHTSELPIDQHITDWARRYGHTIAYTFPSLVDHADGPTIVDHPDQEPREPGRTAWKHGGRHEWTTETVPLL